MMTKELAEAAPNYESLGKVADFLDNLRRPVKEVDRIPGEFPYYGANGQQGTINKFLFDKPLLLLAKDGGFFDEPHRGIAYRIQGKTWVNNHAHVIRPKSGKIEFGYLCRVLENYDVRPFISGTTRSKLTKGQAEKIPIPLPSVEEQRRISAVLDEVDRLRFEHQNALYKIDELFESLQSRAFSGQL